MMLPLADLKGQQLIFPIGTSDYEEITGRPFDLAKHNQPARLIFMGEADQNNTVPYSDCYGDRERRIITSLWGLEILPRATQLIDLYGQSGGKGIFIRYQHGYQFRAFPRPKRQSMVQRELGNLCGGILFGVYQCA